MTLDQLPFCKKATIVQIQHADKAVISRMMALGIFQGEEIEVLHQAPLGDPLQIKVGETLVSLRRVDCQQVEVSPLC